MQSTVQSLFWNIIYWSGIHALYNVFRGAHLAVLGYHSVSDPSNKTDLQNDIYKHLSVPAGIFEKQMGWLQQHGYTFLRFSDLYDIREGKRAMPRRAALLYFDDGYKDNYINAYPILKRLRIPATIFVATDCIDRKKLLWDSTIDPARANIFLSWDDIRAMQDVFDIGTHTVSHRKLTTLMSDEVKEEFEVSRKRIYEMTGKEVIALSYPKSRWTQETRGLAQEAGFEFILAHGRGFRHSSDFRYLEKIPVGPADSMMRFRLKLGVYYPLVSMFGK